MLKWIFVCATCVVLLMTFQPGDDVERVDEDHTHIETPPSSTPTAPPSLSPDSLKIYIDADRSRARNSGVSIERGIRLALDEVNYKIQGRDVELIICDHQGNSQRSLSHLKKFHGDPNGLAVYSGMHSPPLLANKQYIVDNKTLLLVPWAAASPITRYHFEDDKNYVFRLSVDDSKAGQFLVEQMIKQGHKAPYLLLENTGWGKTNEKNINQALAANNLSNSGVKWFNWNIKESQASDIYESVARSHADCVILVSNAAEGKYLAKHMASLPDSKRLPLFSHWGIVDSSFTDFVSYEESERLQLKFIQTSFSFLSSPLSPLGEKVLNNCKAAYPEIKSGKDILAPAGLIHAYDLTKLLIAACDTTNFNQEITLVRDDIRQKLENLTAPVEGLVKTYTHPFSAYSASNKDAHEALGPHDFAMAKFGPEGEILLIPTPSP